MCVCCISLHDVTTVIRYGPAINADQFNDVLNITIQRFTHQIKTVLAKGEWWKIKNDATHISNCFRLNVICVTLNFWLDRKIKWWRIKNKHSMKIDYLCDLPFHFIRRPSIIINYFIFLFFSVIKSFSTFADDALLIISC